MSEVKKIGYDKKKKGVGAEPPNREIQQLDGYMCVVNTVVFVDS